MFGHKARTIKFLKEDIAAIRGQRDRHYDELARKEAELGQKNSELTIVRESYSGRLREMDDLYAQVGDLETRNESLKYELSEARLLNENIREEAAESSRMLELYKALLGQLQIVVKLPAKKIRG
jgi:chromosome segregation ATPase